MKRRRRHKNGRNKEMNRDLISELPDCILHHILSFLDIKHSVQTCILSTKWKDLWKRVPTLTLNSSPWSNYKDISIFVSSIMSKRDASTTLHALDFEHTGRIYIEPDLIKSIVKYAVSHHVQRLRIHVICDIKHFPLCLFSCHTLTSLDLYVANKDFEQMTIFPNSLNLPALISLSLCRFAFCVSHNGRAEPFSKFNSLNTLMLDTFSVLDGKIDAQIICISSATLANLTIQQNYILGMYCQIELSTPSLCTFVSLGYPFTKLSVNHLCSIEHVNIDADMSLWYSKSPSVLLSWLKELTHMRSLIVSSTTLQVLSLVPNLLKLKFRSLCNLKSLKVKMKRLSCASSVAMICTLFDQRPIRPRDEIAKLKETFKEGSASIPDGIIEFLLQNSPSAEVHIIN